jgi:hypothetical protein
VAKAGLQQGIFASKGSAAAFLLLGWRTALSVCQAINIAITVVLPEPVAIFIARRTSSGLACSLAPRMCSQNLVLRLPSFGTTSVSQMIVYSSTWPRISLMIRGRVVLLPGVSEPQGFGENHLPLLERSPLALAGFRNRRDQLRTSPPLDRWSVGRLPLLVEFVMASGDLVRRDLLR